MTLKTQVQNILRDVPATRDSDITLMIELWRRHYPSSLLTGSSGKQAVLLDKLYDLPREDNIKRLRAHIQNVEKLYLPTKPSVAKQRKIKEEEWLDYMRNLKNNE